MRRFIAFMATGCGVGFLPLAPGTWGSVVGMGLFWALRGLPPAAYLAAAAAFIAFAVWVADRASAQFGEDDPSKVVIDEIAGCLVTMALHRPTLAAVAAGFVLFRIFDIAKPPPIRWIECRFAGGAGIVLDDVMAGIYANIALWIVGMIAPMVGVRW